MELTELKTKIKTGKHDSFYIFCGEEQKVMKLYIDQIAKSMNTVPTICDDTSVLTTLRRQHSLTPGSSLLVFYECRDILTSENLQSLVEAVGAFGDTLVIFVFESIDKRLKGYKKYQERIVEFNYLRSDILTKYIQKEINLSARSCEKLIAACESSYGRILLELDKLCCYLSTDAGSNFDCDDALDKLIADGTIYTPPYDAVFDFVDAVLKGKAKLSYQLLATSYASGEATLVLISNLYTSAKAVLQVQSYSGEMKITEATGLTPFQVKLASGRKHIYSNGALLEFMELLQGAEQGIKTGEIEEQFAVEYVLAKFWN